MAFFNVKYNGLLLIGFKNTWTQFNFKLKTHLPHALASAPLLCSSPWPRRALWARLIEGLRTQAQLLRLSPRRSQARAFNNTGVCVCV